MFYVPVLRPHGDESRMPELAEHRAEADDLQGKNGKPIIREPVGKDAYLLTHPRKVAAPPRQSPAPQPARPKFAVTTRPLILPR